MELDDLKTAWGELDRRLETSLALNRSLFKELKLDKARSALGGLARVLWCELISGAVAALVLGSFLAGHLSDARFAIPAIVLQIAAILTIAACVWQLAVVGRIDYSAPVVTIQHELATLRLLRVHVTRWVLLLAPLLWTPLVIVAAKGCFGFDVYREIGRPWIAANIAFGLAVIPVGFWMANRFAARSGGSRVLKHLADAIAGRSLGRAMGLVDEIARFEAEP
jgi:serine/threonine-protein kinase